MSVGRICVRSVHIAEREESVRTAARRMAESKVGTLVVVDGKRTPVGIISDRDVMVRCVVEGRDADAMTVAELMSTPVTTASEEMPLETALVQMSAAGVRRLPVVDDGGHLVGIIAVDDIVALLAEETTTLGRLLTARKS